MSGRVSLSLDMMLLLKARRELAAVELESRQSLQF